MDFSKPFIPEDNTIILLKQSFVRERECDSILSEIPDDFYQKLSIDMKKLEGKSLRDTHVLFDEFVRMKHSKIVRFASVMKLNSSIEKSMSDEEKNFYELVNLSSEFFLKKINS